MFLNCLHFRLTLAGAPRAAWILLPTVVRGRRCGLHFLSTTLSVLVTLVAVDAVVHIAGHIRVLEVVRVIAAVTTRALENRVIVRVDVAGRANSTSIAVAGRELRVLGMVKARVQPVGSAVAVLARCREELGLRRMARIRRVVVILQVASDARCRQRGVVVVNVAVHTLPRGHGVRPGQRKRGIVVVKGRIGPDDRVVAQFALLRKARSCVIWIRGPVVVLQVAGHASCAVQAVVVVHMAVRTLPRRHHVRVGQWEARGGVVKLAVSPEQRVVAGLASCRKTGLDVVHRRDRIVVIVLVAGNAGRARQIVVVVDMAIRTLSRRHHVVPREREAGAVVIERRVEPSGCAMARVARLRKVCRDVVRVRGALIVLQVAGHARRAVQGVVVVNVAVSTLPRRHRVHAGQGETRGRVIELAVGPLHGVVAVLAGRGETRMRDGTGGVGVILLMATDARRVRNAVVVIDVTIRALPRRHGVRSRQWECRLGVIEGRWLPGGRAVAQLAGLRESAANVIGIGRSLEVLQVARHACRCREVVVVVHMAVGTLPGRDRVRPRQREIH